MDEKGHRADGVCQDQGKNIVVRFALLVGGGGTWIFRRFSVDFSGFGFRSGERGSDGIEMVRGTRGSEGIEIVRGTDDENGACELLRERNMRKRSGDGREGGGIGGNVRTWGRKLAELDDVVFLCVLEGDEGRVGHGFGLLSIIHSSMD